MLNRRDLLLAGAAALAASPAAAQTADGPRLTALMDKAMQDALSASPQLMTLTGLDTGANAPAKHRLDDRSVAGPAKMRALFAQMGADLRQFDPASLHGGDLLNYRTAAYLADVTLLARGYVASLYILYFGFLASLAWGAFEASARRRRAASA